MRTFLCYILLFSFKFFGYGQEQKVISVSTPDHINWIAAKQVIFYDLTDFDDERIKQVPYLTLKVNTTDTTIINNALRQIKHTKELTVISDSLWSFGDVFSEFEELKRIVFKCHAARCPWEGKFKANLGDLTRPKHPRLAGTGKTIIYGSLESELDNLEKPLIFVRNGDFHGTHSVSFSRITDFNDNRIKETDYLELKINTSDTTIINYALRKIKHVKELYIKSDSIRYFDGAFLELENLKRVGLYRYNVGDKPEKIGSLKKSDLIHYPQIYGEKESNRGSEQRPHMFFRKSSLPKAGEEWFSGITDLTDERIKWVNDIELYIYTSDTSIINDALKQLNHVKELFIDSDSIRYFGDALLELNNLEELIIDCKNLEKLPKNFGKLSNLKRIHIERSKLTELPKSIINIDSLSIIIIRQTNFSKFPSEIPNIKNGLSYLELDISNIATLPENFSTLQYKKWDDDSLGFIELTNCNSLVKLPPNIRELNFKVYLGGAKSLKNISSLNNGNQPIELSISGLRNRWQARKIIRSLKNTQNVSLKIDIFRMFPFPWFLVRKDGLEKLHLVTRNFKTKQKIVDRLQKRMPNTEIVIE